MPELFAETTAEHISGFPQLLREIWSHLYPESAPPLYRVYFDRPTGTNSEFAATLVLRPEAGDPTVLHTLTSGVTAQVTRAIQEVAYDAITLIRTFDPIMGECSRYTHFPRLQMTTGDVIFPNPGDPEASLTTLIRYTALLHQYLHATLGQLASLRIDLATATRPRGVNTNSGFRSFSFPMSTRGTLEYIRNSLAESSSRPPPTVAPLRPAARRFTRIPIIRTRRRRGHPVAPPHTPGPHDVPTPPDYSPAGMSYDPTTPATPFVDDF